jgi:hypothetical protein
MTSNKHEYKDEERVKIMKLLATDYDGTLYYGQDILASDLQELNNWKEQGNLFAIVTGRSKMTIFDEIAKHNLPVDYVVTNNGSLVYDANGEELLCNQLDHLTAVDLMYAVGEFEDVVSFVVNDGTKRHRIIVNSNASDMKYPHLQPDLSLEEVAELPEYVQIVLSMSSEMAAIKMAEQINEFFSSNVIAYPNVYCVDIVPKDVSKATGLEFVAEYADIADADIYVMGDGYNDLPMIEFSPNGAAVFTAPEEVKEGALGGVFGSVGEYIESILD